MINASFAYAKQAIPVVLKPHPNQSAMQTDVGYCKKVSSQITDPGWLLALHGSTAADRLLLSVLVAKAKENSQET